jgi:MFS family permease
MDHQRRALWSVVLFGVVSLLADVTYESARSIIGPYMAVLGASAVAISVVSGAGELVGYGLRLVSGRLADRMQRYWHLVWIGYTVNLLAVPLLALVGRWEIAAVCVIAERLGKAIRAPARDALLAQATQHIGHGKGFGIHEALDQIGAVTGPLLVAAAMAVGLGYRGALGLLIVPALAALGTLHLVQRRFPPAEQAPLQSTEKSATPVALPTTFYHFLIAVCLAAAGMVDFPLLAYHIHTAGFGQALVPLLYALAMAVDALAALVLGRLFDRLGLRTLAAASVVSSIASVLVVASGSPASGIVLPVALALGVVAWGVGMGAHESILRASVAVIVPARLRGSAFGLLSAWYGGAWFLGSSLLGMLYRWHPMAMAVAAAALQGAAAAIWFISGRTHTN